MFAVRLFGPPVIEGEEGPLNGRAAQRHRLGLLALLSAAPGHQLSRDKLLAYLWPDADAKRARHLLNVSVHVLRRELGEDALASVGDDVRLDPGIIRSDVAAFETAIAEGDAERAVGLYTAPFLDGFHLNGSTEFERWQDGERDRLAGLYERALESLAAEAEAAEDTEAAVEWWRRLAAHNPCSGRIALGLMRALETAGDHGSAIRHAHAHEALLREELGAEPDPDVLALVERLKAKPSGASPPGFKPEPDGALAVTGPVAQEGEGMRGKSWLPWATRAAALVLIAMIGGSRFLRPDPEALEPATPAVLSLEPNRVLVFPFVNRTGDPELDRLGAMAADWITQGLAETGMVRGVSAMGTEPVEAQEALGGLPGAARALAGAHRAAIVIYGSFYRQGDSIAFEAQVTDVASGELLRAIGGITASIEAPLAAVQELRQRTTSSLATVLDPLLKSWASAASQPPSYEAYQLFAEGLELFFADWMEGSGRQERYRRAAEYFHRAWALDTAFSVPLLWAVYAHSHAGNRPRADSLTLALDQRRDRLTRWERALLDAHLAVLRGDLRGEYRAYSRVVEMTPGGEWNFKLGLAAYKVGQPQEAVDLLSQVDPRQGWLSQWEPYWSILGASQHLLGDHEQELQDARRGLRQFPESRTMRLREVRALGALGRAELGTWQDDEQLVRYLVDELLNHGHESAANELIADYLSRYDSNQDTLYRRTTESPLRDAFWHARWLEWGGRLDEAEEMLEAKIGKDPESPFARQALSQLGVLAAKRGDRESALRFSSQLSEFEVTRPFARGLVLFHRARIAAALGDNEEAVRLLKQARELGVWGQGELHSKIWFPQSLRDYPPFQEFVRPKGVTAADRLPRLPASLLPYEDEN